jgi:hypothetical protein
MRWEIRRTTDLGKALSEGGELPIQNAKGESQHICDQHTPVTPSLSQPVVPTPTSFLFVPTVAPTIVPTVDVPTVAPPVEETAVPIETPAPVPTATPTEIPTPEELPPPPVQLPGYN